MENNNIFENLLSLKEASNIWHIDDSVLRKAILSNRLKDGADVKKFGKQWVVTKDAMEREYGPAKKTNKIEEYSKLEIFQVYYYIGNITLKYSQKYKMTLAQTNSIFDKFGIQEYLFTCFDYLHLGNINDVVTDVASRIRRGISFE
ncbi:MAG: DUF3791 domain-containing protein [bacterium]|nr:DUF3791 domain-containing protein [bacterium]